MIYSVLLQGKAPFVQTADFEKFFLRFCCRKLESPAQRQSKNLLIGKMTLFKGSWFSAAPIVACPFIYSVRGIFFTVPGKVICFRDLASRVQFLFFHPREFSMNEVT